MRQNRYVAYKPDYVKLQSALKNKTVYNPGESGENMNQTAETIQDAMHQAGLQTYQDLAAERDTLRADKKRLELHLDIENVNKKMAYRIADRYEWRYKLWLTIAVTTWVAVLLWRAWVFFN